MLKNNTWIALSLGTLVAVSCTSDDMATTSESATNTESSTSVTNSATETMTMSGTMSGTMTDPTMSGTMSGTMSSTATNTMTVTETDPTTMTDPTTATDTDPTTATDTDVSATDTDPTATDTDVTATDTDTTDGTTTDAGFCGDGIIDPGEQCDDGNNEDGDGCEGDCTIPPPPTCPNEETAIKCDGETDLWYQAMELGCSDNESETPVIYDDSMNSNNPNAWRIAKGFGTYMEMGELLYGPQGGESFLMLSTGVISQPNDQGIVTESNNSQGSNGDNQNDDSNSLPPPIQVAEGSNNGNGGTPFMDCDGVNDCSDSLESAWMLGSGDPNDKIWVTWKADVPDLVESYSFSFAYFSSEWPTYVNTSFNDLLIGWQTSEAYTGNTTFIGDAPVTITSLNQYFIDDGYTGNEPQLAGTGFETRAGSDWFGVNQNVVGGETVTFTIMLADMSDSILATAALIDNFHWNCEACIPVDDPACTGEVPDPKCCGVVEPQ